MIIIPQKNRIVNHSFVRNDIFHSLLFYMLIYLQLLSLEKSSRLCIKMKVCFLVCPDTIEEEKNSETKSFMFFFFVQRKANGNVSFENIDIKDNLTQRDECLALKF